MIYNTVITIFCLIMPLVILRSSIKEIISNKNYNVKFLLKKYPYEILTYLTFVLGFILRGVCINIVPNGLNIDEASAGYEAFSILKYGVDRNGNSFPVFLEAWGSGQNVLYTYILIPFIKLLGLNIISTRLPMVLIGCFSLYVWYKLLYEIQDKKFALIGLAFLAICPWHIMKSRWGLESNIFPDMILYAIFYLVMFLKNKRKRYFYISCIILGLTSYAYGTAYFFLPVFVIPLLIYLRWRKEINTKTAFFGLLTVIIIALPIMLYVLINTFNLKEIHIGPFTVPKLPVNRYEEQTSLFSSVGFFTNIIKNFKNSMKLLLTQNDGLIWNNISGIGIIYLTTLPFTILGLIMNFRKRSKEKNIMNIWFFASFLLLLVLTECNINRINILIIPLIYYSVCGICFSLKIEHKLYLIELIIYTFSFFVFSTTYFDKDRYNGPVFVSNIKDVIEYVDELDVEKVYIQYAFKEPYIYVLYYTKYDTNQFINTVNHFDNYNLGRFDNVKSFGKYYFYIPKEISKDEKCAYVLKKGNESYIQDDDYTIKEFDDFVVYLKNDVLK